MTVSLLCRRFVLTVALLTVLVAGTILPVEAQTADTTTVTQSALAVSPAILENILTPGEPSAFSVEVRNITNFPLPIKSFVRGLTTEAHTSDLSEEEQKRLDASQWFVIEEPDFILQPNQSRKVSGTIQTPIDADPGGHYATIFFQPLVPAEALSPSTAYINARVGVLSFLIVKGDISQSAELKKDLQTTKLVRRGPITFTFSVHNSGNVHLLPTGKVAIYKFNMHVADITIPPGVVLPNSSREYTVEWEGAGPGKYRAELSIEYGADGLQLSKSSVSFWIVPWVGLLFSLITLGVGVFFVIKTRRRWHHVWQELRGSKKD